MNRIRNSSGKNKPAKEESPKAGESVARKFIDIINIFSYFDKARLVHVMPYVFFLTALAIIYIGNSYYAERTIREIDKTDKEIKELRSEFVTGKSELMSNCKLTAVAASISGRGIKESTEAPRKIVVEHKSASKP